MRTDDIRSLAELVEAIREDSRFAGYEVCDEGVGRAEVRVGEVSLTLCDARVYSDSRTLEPHLARARRGATRLVLLGTEDELAEGARHGDSSELALHTLPMSRARALRTLPAELDLLALRRRARERARLADRYQYELSELLTIARAISSERSVERLLGLILEKSRYISGADAGSVYIVETGGNFDQVPHRLRFIVSQNDSMVVDFREFSLPVDDTSIVGKVVLARRAINIPDLYRLGEPDGNPWGVNHNRTLDDKSGYQTRSMLTFPLINQRDDVIGVIQLINRKRDPASRLHAPEDFEKQVIPFDRRSEELCETLASQAGVSLENALLYQEIQQLFEGLVRASVTAIESRDPTTSGHSQRVATLTRGLAEVVDRIDAGPLSEVRFTADDLRQIEYAGLLHDFGKVGVREKVLVKARKLYEHERDLVLMRFDYLKKSAEADFLRRRLESVLRGELPAGAAAVAMGLLDLDAAARRELGELDELIEFILASNEPTVVAEGSFGRLTEIAARRYRDARGEERPYLTQSEVASLRVQRGSLTPEERAEIESHVLHTHNFLATIPWGRKLRKIPLIAGAHHEKLDGTGYPFGLKAEEIPVEARMMAITDIFDALTASDRPYKRAVPTERALGILEAEARSGKCDPELFRVFVEAQVWQRLGPAS